MKTNVQFIQEIYDEMEANLHRWLPDERVLAPRLMASLLRKVLFLSLVGVTIKENDGNTRQFEHVTSAQSKINEVTGQQLPLVSITPGDFAEPNSFINFFDLDNKEWHSCDLSDVVVFDVLETFENPAYAPGCTMQQILENVMKSLDQ